MPKTFLHPGRTSPIALVVRADIGDGSADALTELDGEAETVSGLLFEAGYDVHLLTSGKYSEVVALLRDDDICNRLVIFHYCGHAAGKIVMLKDDDGKPIEVMAEALASQMVGDTAALRLVYLNACLTETQEAAYREVFSQVNFIGTKVELPDWYARKFAEAFYQRFLCADAGFGDVRLRHALQRSAGEDMGWKPERVDRVFSFRREGEAQPAVAQLPDLNFRAAEGVGLISSYVLKHRGWRVPKTVFLYCAALIAIQAFFMFCAGYWSATSSPAFQAAFGYVPDCSTITAMHRASHILELEEGVGAYVRDNLKAICQPSDGGIRDPASKSDVLATPPPPMVEIEPGHLNRAFGPFIETLRTVFLCCVMIFLCTQVYRRLPRDYPYFFSARWKEWLTHRNNRKYLALFVLGLVCVTGYHVVRAHSALSETTISLNHFGSSTWLEARWAFFSAYKSTWAEFEGLHASICASVANSENADLAQQYKSVCPEFQESGTFPEIDFREPGYFELYIRPYAFYLGYSLFNYLATALPILAVIINGFTFSATHMQLRLKSLRVQVRLTRDGFLTDSVFAIRKFDEAWREMAGHIGRFAMTFVAITAFATYEMLIGKTTTALFAQIMMLLVFLLVLLGTLNVREVWMSFQDELNKIRTMLSDIHDPDELARIAEFEQRLNSSGLPVYRRTIASFVVGILAFIYLTILLFQGWGWTVFTHSLPIFGSWSRAG